MSLTRGTPQSSQIITMERMLQERDDEIERLRCDLETAESALDAQTDFRAEIERLRGEVERWKRARQAALDGGEILKEQLATERQRARLPEELVARLSAIVGDGNKPEPRNRADLIEPLLSDILAALEPKA